MEEQHGSVYAVEKKCTRHKFGGGFAAPVVIQRACDGDDVSLNIDCESCAVLFLISHSLGAPKLYPMGTWIG